MSIFTFDEPILLVSVKTQEMVIMPSAVYKDFKAINSTPELVWSNVIFELKKHSENLMTEVKIERTFDLFLRGKNQVNLV